VRRTRVALIFRLPASCWPSTSCRRNRPWQCWLSNYRLHLYRVQRPATDTIHVHGVMTTIRCPSSSVRAWAITLNRVSHQAVTTGTRRLLALKYLQTRQRAPVW